MSRPIKSATCLEEVIEEWKEQGRDIPMRDVPYSVLHLVSRYFPPQGEWMQFAADLGIERIQTLVEIEGDAKVQGQWGSEAALMYFAKKTTANPPSFGDLITLLHKKFIRLDALHALHDSGKVEKFLQERRCNNIIQQNGQKKLFHVDDNDLLQKLDKMVSNGRHNFARNQTHGMHTSQQELAATLSAKFAYLDLQRYTVNACQIVDRQASKDDIKFLEELDRKKPDDSQMVVQRASSNTLPKADGLLLLSKPTVLLTYCSDVDNILPELVQRFQDAGIGVVAEHVLKGRGVLEINPIAAWESLFKQCHFVVPVLSNKYLQEINRPDDTIESQSVRFIYDLYTGRYVSDGCRNHIVRPLIVSDVNPQILRNVNPTLRMRWRIWEDVDKLFKYKVFRAYPSTANQLNAILHLNTLHKDLDFWTEPRLIGESVDIMVPPVLFTQVVNFIQDTGTRFEIMIENVQSLICDQQAEHLNPTGMDRIVRQYKSARDGFLSWNKFHRVSDIHTYMEALASRHPDFVKVLNIGYSTHGRELKVIQIGRPLKSRTKKPAIWIDAGIHAREWVAPAAAIYFIHQLVAGVARNDSRVLRYVRNVDWYIFPVVNPDGYEYTHTSSRMWRKTRSRHSIFCNGVDPNRNFGFHWNENGASDDACSEIYAGPRAFSEPESVALSRFLLKNNDTIKVYITMHSYGQYWLTPWGFTSKLPVDYKHLYDLAFKATEALRRVSGTRYRIGSSTNVLYAAAGGSDDWAKGVAGIKYSYTVELRDRGRHGFLLPQRLIEPTSKETWAAMMAIADAVIAGLP